MTKPLTEQQKWDRRISSDPATGCHLWLKFLNEHGYGQTRIGGRKGKNILAHRLAWLRAHGSLPSALGVLHRCDNRRCVNAAHLFLGTHVENMHDMAVKGRHRVGDLPRGGDHHMVMAKLTAQEVLAIRADFRTQREIAEEYGVHQGTISRLKTGVSFAFIIG